MAKRQSTLLVWSKTIPAKKLREESENEREIEKDDRESEVGFSDMSEADEAETTSEKEAEMTGGCMPKAAPTNCTVQCCVSTDRAFQPVDKRTLLTFTNKDQKRNFQPQWYKQFPWVSVCTTSKKAYCLYCRHASQHNLITFSKMEEKAFTETGFQNWRKAVDKFKAHECSHAHREAKMKWIARQQPTIEAQISSQMAQLQMTRRHGLVTQLRAIVFLTRQGIAIRGHTESEGNLHQLLQVWSKENEVVKNWLRENRLLYKPSGS